MRKQNRAGAVDRRRSAVRNDRDLLLRSNAWQRIQMVLNGVGEATGASLGDDRREHAQSNPLSPPRRPQTNAPSQLNHF